MNRYGYCPYCKRYIGTDKRAAAHKECCKNATPAIRELHSGIKQRKVKYED